MLASILRQAIPLLSELQAPRFRPPVKLMRGTEVDFTVRNFQIKTIDSPAEFRQVLGLRRDVFHREFAGRKLCWRSDKDRYDDVADHLAIFDRESNKIAGVYRLIDSQSAGTFYSSSEFDIDGLLALTGHKLELSRACIRPEYRNGTVIALLWRGLLMYAAKAKIDYLFGLSSVTTTDPIKIAHIHQYFHAAGLIHDSLTALPTDKYRIENFDEILMNVRKDPQTEATGAAAVPSLLKTYIKAGARVCSQPVIDSAFHCADWLTILDMRQLNASYGRKFVQP